MLEKEFRDKHVRPWLKLIECYYFIKEAAALRGIPDIIGCYRSMYFALEIKKNKTEASRRTGRIVQQRYELKKITDHGGFGAIVYPENFEEMKKNFLFCADKIQRLRSKHNRMNLH